MSSRPDLVLRFCDVAAARYAVTRWHYAKVLPTGKLVKVGVWEDGSFVGVLIFSRGASPWLGKRWGLESTEIAEMTRLAMRHHRTPTSRILSIAVKMVAKANPGLRLLVSFSDPKEGHVGTLYQAANWIYCGRANATVEYLIGGRWRHTRGAYWKAKGRDVPTRVVPGKLRYVFPLDSQTRRFAEQLRLPYPRAGSLETEASPIQEEEGGETPTPALHSAILGALTPDLLKPVYRRRVEDGAHPTTGHSYVASEALYHLAGGRDAGWSSYQIRHEGESHWYLRSPDGSVVDLTAAQFETPVPYADGSRRGFLHPSPSKRARTVIARVQETPDA